MTRVGIFTGSVPNDGLGDSLLTGAIKVNSNFLEIYNYLGNGNDLGVGGDISAEVTLEGAAPASATSTGTAGDIRYDADYIYVCIATNTWKRVAISTWS